MFKKLRNKFLILNMTIISIMMVAAFAAIYYITYTKIQLENQNKIHSITEVTSFDNSIVFNENYFTSNKITIQSIPSDYVHSFSIEVDENGNILTLQTLIDMPQDIYEEAAKYVFEEETNSKVKLFNKTWQYEVTDLNKSGVIMGENGSQFIINAKERYLITFLDITESQNTLNGLLLTFLVVGLIMLIFIFLISMYFANKAIKPIAETWDKQKQFVTDASHELKTPLAIIDANSDALLANEEETIKSQSKWLDYIKEETNRMSKLINNLLYLAKTENNDIKTNYLNFNMSNTTNNIILSMETIIFEKDLNLSYKIQPEIIIKNDEDQIKQVIMILLDNAIKYTNQKGYIEIFLRKSKHEVIFSISNTGNGIRNQDLPKIFDRFYRTDPSRNSQNGGYGLGLSLAKAIIDRSNGKIWATSGENKTTLTFTLNLP